MILSYSSAAKKGKEMTKGVTRGEAPISLKLFIEVIQPIAK